MSAIGSIMGIPTPRWARSLMGAEPPGIKNLTYQQNGKYIIPVSSNVNAMRIELWSGHFDSPVSSVIIRDIKTQPGMKLSVTITDSSVSVDGYPGLPQTILKQAPNLGGVRIRYEAI